MDGSPVLRYLSCPGQEDLPPLSLHPLVAVVLSDLEAGVDPESIANWLAEHLGQPLEALTEIVLDVKMCYKRHLARSDGDRFSRLGMDGRDRLLAEVAASGTILRARDVIFSGDRSLFPLTLEWVVTRYCNRGCIYCYQGAIPSAKPKDALLPGHRVMKILEEGARLGATTFFITGGEPLLRDDIYDILVHALGLGFDLDILTKQFIREADVARLAAAGLREINVSVDSLDPEIASQMTGVRTYAHDIACSIERLVRHGVNVGINMVATPRNIDSIPATLAKLEGLGASHIQIDPYQTNLERHSDTLALSEAQLERIRAWIQDYAGAMEVHFGADRRPTNPAEKAERFRRDHLVCASGITTLLFLNDGRVSKCDKRLPGGEVVVGDLSQQSVYDVWSSQRLVESFKPPRELYKGTLCYDCGEFNTCHERGRCYYDAYLTSGTLYGPDSSCPFIGGTARSVC